MIGRNRLLSVPKQNKRTLYRRLGVNKASVNQLSEKGLDSYPMSLSSRPAWCDRENRPHIGSVLHFPRAPGIWTPPYFWPIRDSAQSVPSPFPKRDVGYPQAPRGGFTGSAYGCLWITIPKGRLQPKAISETSPDPFQLTSNEEELTNELQFA